MVSRPPPVSSFSLCDLRLFVIKRIYLSKKEVLRASLVWLGRLVPGLYEVIQYTLSALHGPAAVPPGVGAAQYGIVDAPAGAMEGVTSAQETAFSQLKARQDRRSNLVLELNMNSNPRSTA